MTAFSYRIANATLDAVATNEGNEVIEEITGMSSSLESYLQYICRSLIPCPLVPKYRQNSKNPRNRFEQKIRELISRNFPVPLTDFLFTGVLSSAFHLYKPWIYFTTVNLCLNFYLIPVVL